MNSHKTLALAVVIFAASASTPADAKVLSGAQCNEIILRLKEGYPVTELRQFTIVDAQKPQIIFRKTSVPLRESDPIIQKMYELKVIPDFKTLADARKRDLTPEQTKAITESNMKLASSDAIGFLEQMLIDKVPQQQALQRSAALYEKVYTVNQFEKLFDTDFELELLPGQIGLVQTHLKLKVPTRPSDFDLMAADLFENTEQIWANRLKKFNKTESGLPTPFDFIIAGERFREWYNWDSYFAVLGLLATKKIEVAKMITENFLDAIEKYSFVPNGGRDYYLDRSQPPFTSEMVVEVYNLIKSQDALRANRWLKERAYPLLVREYQYWMSDSYDPAYGLNRYWSALDTPRPERYGTDNEEDFGESNLHTRVAAASGEDFTITQLRRAADILSVKLNALLWKYEKNLAYIAGELGDSKAAQAFSEQASNRKENFDHYLWDPKEKVWRDFDRQFGQRLDQFVSPNIYTPLFVGMADQDQAASVVRFLHRSPYEGGILGKGGLIASNVEQELKPENPSEKPDDTEVEKKFQWDRPNTWPPHNIMALIGLKKYGFNKEARRLAQNILISVGAIKKDTSSIYEKRNGLTGKLPVEKGTRYPNQKDLIWSHVEVIKALEILGYKFE